MWGNNSSRLNTGSNINVNTRMKNFTSDVSSMVVSLWNQNYSITISPAIGPDGNGVMQYDQNRQGKTALSLDACEALIEEFKTVILPIYKDVVLNGAECPESKSVTVETGREPKKNIIGIEMTAPVDGTKVPDMHFVYYGLVDANGISSQANTFKHKFSKRMVRVDYNPNTGLSGEEVATNADFNLFINMISKAELILPYSEHAKKFSSERSKTFTPGNGVGGNTYTGSTAGASNGGAGMNFASSPSYGGAGFGMFGGALNGDAEELPFN